MPLGSSSLVRSNVQRLEVGGVWTGGGAAANCTKASADWSKGISAVNYNAATGKYRITLTEWGQQLVHNSQIDICRAAGGAPRVANLVRGSFAVAADGQSATVDFEVWDLATPTLTDLVATDKLLIGLSFATAAPG